MPRRTVTRVALGLLAPAAAAIALACAVRRSGGAPSRSGAQQPERAAAGPERAAAGPERAGPDRLRAFVSHRFNPAVIRLGLVGGRRSPWAYLEHVGRRSGTVYRTPVLPMVVGDHAFVPLPYGVAVDWSRNVRTSGHCRLQRRGLVFELDEPAVIGAREHPGVPEWYRSVLERRGRRYLRLHVLAATPGDLDSVRAEAGSALPARDASRSPA